MRRSAVGASTGQFTFPSPVPGFNALTLHPPFLACVSELLGVAITELRLTQSDLWPKYGRSSTGAAASEASVSKAAVEARYGMCGIYMTSYRGALP